LESPCNFFVRLRGSQLTNLALMGWECETKLLYQQIYPSMAYLRST
jgi:hypothetical protein